MHKIRVAVLGCGAISGAYLSSMINRFQILEIAGCCDRNTERAQETAEKYNIQALSIEEIIADDSIEIVVNLTPPTAHYSVIKQLLEAGKHVYSEKVLAVELEEAAELVRIANDKNLYLGVAPDTFLGASIQTARYVVESGMIGQITSFHCSLNRDGSIMAEHSPFTIKPGAGIGFDVGIYFLTAMLSILGPVKEVSGITKTLNKNRKHIFVEKLDEPYEIECENLMAATLNFECGTVGSVLFDSNSIFLTPEKPTIVLFGTQGIMYMSDPNLFGGEVKVILKGNSEPVVVQQSHAFTGESRGLGVAEMAWSMKKGRVNRANKEMAYHALEILNGIVQSGETKQHVAIKSTFIKTPPLPRGYLDKSYLYSQEESGLAQ
ncbi:Gfo/Idh/MocA family oxidoreductase [Paenibacillus albidus]|uniref:Gfo/Idh/MocA family protein n=1 Tax=Paenibacillus albidus TaxID=2041023 RepID=UPI001BE4F96F|nr:Gfo/Idh/MocA family oxidoreductase [Paenibacillus albidus]MBT2291532.1 Gfo/Idh/MocA family oxidoreductase [Paenibacillus albidus]